MDGSTTPARPAAHPPGRPLMFGLLSAWLAAAPAHASSLGVALGGGIDLPDPYAPSAKIGPTGNLVVPVRIDLTEAARLRVSAEVLFARGQDTVSWQVSNGRVGERMRGIFLSGGLLAGPEVKIPTKGSLTPYFGASAGLALALTGHSRMLWDEAIGGVEGPGNADLFDRSYYPDIEELRGGTVEPFGRQLVPATDFALGFESNLVWAELGYGMQFVRSAPLRRTPAAIDAQHEAYGWNVLRVSVGVATTFGPGAR